MNEINPNERSVLEIITNVSKPWARLTPQEQVILYWETGLESETLDQFNVRMMKLRNCNFTILSFFTDDEERDAVLSYWANVDEYDDVNNEFLLGLIPNSI